MEKFVFAILGIVVGFVLGWFVFSASPVVEEPVKTEDVAPATPVESEVTLPEASTPVEVVPMPPQEVVEPVKEKVAE